MAKYLVMASYTAEGAKGVLKDGGTKRKQVAETLLRSAGGKVEAFYFALGQYDLYAIIDAPDIVSVATVSLAISASGALKTHTVTLMTPEEIDQVAKKGATYTPPGR